MSEEIRKAEGLTPSERILADLGDNAFLSLWSYPNLFIDKKKNNAGDGKELCDLLVVCGDNVIIFSDKAIGWQKDQPIEIAWPRFYRRAISASVEQIKGAARWISDFPDRIFTDRACTQKLPIVLPPPDRARFHGIVVAGGAYKACQTFTKDDSGSFMIAPWIKGDAAHVDFAQPGFTPFTIGDTNPGGMFIHVFDPEGISRLLTNLDTITDFTEYLVKRERYLRSGELMLAYGEEDLLAAYLITGLTTGAHDFERKRKKKFKGAALVIPQGGWSKYLWSDAKLAKDLADEPSYSWDRLIGLFTDNVIAGTSVSLLGYTASTQESERALRFMARESRFTRRGLGEAVLSAYEKAAEMKQDRFTRVMQPQGEFADPTLVYVFMILAYPADMEALGGYEQYRKVRTAMLETYCYVVLSENRHLQTAVGIAVDASFAQTGRRGGVRRPRGHSTRRVDGAAIGGCL